MAERTKIIGSGERDPEFIRADIERTRRKMRRTVGEMQERFTPEHMKSVAKSVLKEQTVDRAERMTRKAREGMMKARTSMYELVRDNPLPAAMVGLGLSWFLTDILMAGKSLEAGREYGEYAGREHRRRFPEGAGPDASRQESRRALEGRGLMAGSYGSFLEQNPIVLLAASIAAGAALGLSMLSAETEGNLGEMVRKVRSKAQIKKEQFNQELRETS